MEHKQEPVLWAQKLHKTFGDQTAVKEISFHLDPGEILGVVGPNGAGKTTTIRMLMNIIAPDSGEIRFRGKPFEEVLKDQIGYLPEERGLYRKLSIQETLLLFGRLKSIPRADILPRAESWLKRLDLWDHRHKKVEALSKGMAQKLQILTTLLHQPHLLVLDEPFSGLDPVNIELIKNLILEEKKRGAAIIFSTHLMDWAEKMVDRVIMIHRGSVVLEGSLDEIQNRFGDRFVHIRYQGDGNRIGELPMVQSITDFGRSMEIELHAPGDRKALLQALFPLVDLESFTTSRPSLHNIFVRLSGQESLPDTPPVPVAEQEQEHGSL